MELTNQEAIEILKANYPAPNYSELCEAVDMALTLLREQEVMKPKKALWIRPTYQDCYCSRCEMQPEHEPGEDVPLYPYCPYCGAEMEVKWDA